MSIEAKKSQRETDKKTESFLKVKEIIEVLPMRIGIAADHGGFELKQHLMQKLADSGFEVADFGNNQLNQDDDYPDFVVPMANAVATGKADRGIAICGSGVGACVAINKVRNARACLINDTFSARQGVEDDNLNILCLGGRVVGYELAWELVTTFLAARFSMKERHLRRLAKVAALDK
jgi:ribose 5-phosphate isomerase B